MLNVSFCQLKAERYSDCVKTCQVILKDIDPLSVKANYRAAFSLYTQKKYNESLPFIKEGLKLEPKNSSLRKLYNDIRDAIKGKKDYFEDNIKGIVSSDTY